MCGIAGIVHRDQGRGVDLEVLGRMTDALSHRGPDDRGLWAEPGVGLGHRRLSIIDLVSGHQPMATAAGQLWITYNGELYNYLELREELRAEGRVFSTQSDTEVLLQLYEARGEQCLRQLNGMFAFALWDRRRQRLLAARDHLGIKPFYYYADGEIFLFASEIKSLLQHPRLRPELDPEALQDYLDLQYCLGDKTLFKGIKRLLPGHCLTWEEGQVRVAQYWDADFTPQEDYAEEEFVPRLAHLLEDAVRLQLRSDVPLGAHLSGGLDSSALACLAARQLGGPLQVFTGGFKEHSKYDESAYAKLVAQHLGAVYHEVFPQAADLAASFEKLVYFLDEPIAGAAVFPQYFLSELASRHVKVVLGGQGGDEIFCGYARYLVAYLEGCLQQAIYGRRPGSGVQDLGLEELSGSLYYLRGYEPTIMKYFGQDLFGDPAERYYLLLKRSQDMEGVLTGDWRALGYSTREVFRAEFMAPRTDALIDRMLYMDLKNHLQSLLQLEDRTSMAVSLESRLPLLDRRIVDLVFAAPAHHRFAAGQPKHLLRRALQGIVPQPVLDRRDKMGFPVPIYEWFKGELRPFVEDILLGQTTRQRGFFAMKGVEQCIRGEQPIGRTVWGLLSLELWFRAYFDGR
jgi:asparagine synthase (glutamine-hydrolysing)